MFIVTVSTDAGISYLRGTIWTFADRRDRAQEFETATAAKAALDKAKKFMHPRIYKAAQIVKEG